jgi:hypothetical protein
VKKTSREMQEKKRKKEFASKPKSHSMLQLSLFPALHKQASNQFHLYLQEKRERERACMNDYEKWIQQTTNPIYNSLLPPSTLHRRANPHLQKRMAGASYMHAHQKKKMEDQTEKNL